MQYQIAAKQILAPPRGGGFMELKDVIQNRRSIRKYKSEKIHRDLILQLLEAARLAPSGTNRQPSRFVVVQDEARRRELQVAAFDQKWMSNAPVIIVCCADVNAYLRSNLRTRVEELIEVGGFEDSPLMREYVNLAPEKIEQVKEVLPTATFNVGIAIEHVVLAATDLGLGTCWVQMIDRSKIRKICSLPDHLFVVTLLVVGYPDETPKPRPRLPLEQIVIGEF
jgi:nitroreductase